MRGEIVVLWKQVSEINLGELFFMMPSFSTMIRSTHLSPVPGVLQHTRPKLYADTDVDISILPGIDTLGIEYMTNIEILDTSTDISGIVSVF